jgi:hypothetical protein
MTVPASLAGIDNPASDLVHTALQQSCAVCGAGRGVLCHNVAPFVGELPGRVVHYDRLHDRSRKADE